MSHSAQIAAILVLTLVVIGLLNGLIRIPKRRRSQDYDASSDGGLWSSDDGGHHSGGHGHDGGHSGDSGGSDGGGGHSGD